VCQDNKAGRDEYERRKRVMWERQGKECGLKISPQCLKKLPWEYATFEHSNGRGHGGGKRDDRIYDKKGNAMNMVCCPSCNLLKASRSLKAVLGEVNLGD